MNITHFSRAARRALTCLAFLHIIIPSAKGAGQPDPPKGFEEFRKGIMNDFNSFRSRILEHYADFLAGEWHEYESLEAESKYSEPKPETIPTALNIETEEGDTLKKEMLASLGFSFNAESGEVKTPANLEWLRESVNIYKSLPSDTLADTGAADLVERKRGGDIVTGDGITDSYDGEIFGFYGMKFALPRVDFNIRDSVGATIDYSYQWEELNEAGVADAVNPHLRKLQEATGLSDYHLFEMIMAWLDSKFPTANDASRMSAAHYLLANMGYGVRIAMDDDGTPYMLLPFGEKVFGRAHFNLGKEYYVFSTPGKEQKKRIGLKTPQLPYNTDLGDDIDLRFESLNLPEKPYHYAFEHEGLKLEGELNENIMPLLYRYPQMDTGGFAACTVSPEVRRDVVRQLREQLGELDTMKGADKLLAMIQFAFPYATDDNFHGFEKPYFFEESLYYPKSDCEDRAVFYSYLLWNAFGLENDLIAYPYHEATAIKAEKVWGGTSHYTDGGNNYFISDPTFQGAPTGQCMPKFEGVRPTIDLRYSAE